MALPVAALLGLHLLMLAASATPVPSTPSPTTQPPTPTPTSAPHTLTERERALDFWFVTLGLTIVILVVRVVEIVAPKVPFITEVSGIIVLGLIVGMFIWAGDTLRDDDRKYIDHFKLEPATFMDFILPVIILDAGFSMNHGGVLRSLGTVLLLAVVGTLISTMLIGWLVYVSTSWAVPQLHDHDGGEFICLTFGALLSATDPVSVIAILGSIYGVTNQEPPLLYNIIFGESVLNDAVAIVLYQVFVKFIDKRLTAATVGAAIGEFIKVFLCSCLIGYAYGILAALVTKHVNLSHNKHMEVLLMLLFSFGAYYLCEVLNMSGIMGLFIAARMSGHHAAKNISQDGRWLTPDVFKTIAVLAESAVFFLLGAAVWANEQNWNFGFIAVVLVVCISSRFMMVFPLCSLTNLTRKTEKITMRMQLFTAFSGLRGAIAFSLVSILAVEKNVSRDVGNMMLTATLVVILFTCLVFGGGALPLLKALRLHEVKRRALDPEPGAGADGAVATDNQFKNVGRAIRRLEKTYIQPHLRRKVTLGAAGPGAGPAAQAEPVAVGDVAHHPPVTPNAEVMVELSPPSDPDALDTPLVYTPPNTAGDV